METASALKRIVGVAAIALALAAVANSAGDRVAPIAPAAVEGIRVEGPSISAGQTATQLPDGSWLLAGGWDAAGAVTGQLLRLKKGSKRAEILRSRLATPRAGHTATVLTDGTVLIVGGIDRDRQPTVQVERFIPATDQVEAMGDVGLDARTGHSATLLMDGRLLVAGGSDVSTYVRSDAQLLDTRSWQIESVRSEMNSARRSHLAALLSNDDVILWGGQGRDEKQVGSAEFFRRDAGRFLSPNEAGGETQDTTLNSPPRLIASLPSINATNVNVDAALVMRFSKPLAPESLNIRTVTLLGPGGAVSASVVGAERGLLLFVTPMADLLPGSSYTLFVQGAQDAQGRSLPFTAVGFRTASIVTASRQPASIPQIVRPEEVLNDDDGEMWLPGKRNLTGVWRSGRAANSLRALPKRSVLAKVLYGKNTKDALPSAPPGVTALAGQVLKLNATPLANVTLSIGAQRVTTDESGEFLLTNIPAGAQTLVIDGASAGRGKRQYGRYEYRAIVEAGKTNALPFVIWMTRLDARYEVSIPSPTRTETVVSNPRIPGLELRIPAGTVIRDARGKIVSAVSMTAIPVDQPPFPLPNSFVPVYFTVQPGGAHLQGLNLKVAKGARLIYPNFSKAQPGSRMDFWNYDSREKGWYVYGQGTVSPDGRQIIPDDGVVIYEFSGAMIALPNTAPAEGPPGGGDDNCVSPPESGAADGGDPVDCFTGLFLHERTDLAANDVIPIQIERAYRPRDTVSRAFGIGTSLSYDIFLIGDTGPWTYQELILEDGARIRFNRTSSGTQWTDAVYASSTTPGRFFGATIRWNTSSGTGWLLTLRNGTVYTFPDAFQSSSARCSAPLQMQDRNGNVVSFTRDSTCNLTKVTSPNGRSISLTYDSSNRVTQAIDGLGHAVTYQYDGSGRLASATDADNKTESYTYDSQHRMLTVTDKRGNTMVTNAYDSNGRVSQQTYADSATASFAYTLNGSGKVTQTDYTDERGLVRRIQFNAAGLPMTITKAVGKPEQQVLTFDRNSSSNLVTSRTDALGRVTTYQYDSKGNTTQVTYLSGTGDATTWDYTYESDFSQIASITDPLSHTTTYSHDSKGNLTSTVDPLLHATTFTYNNAGQPLTATRYLGSSAITTTYTYSSGDLASVTDPLNRTVHFYVDALGRVVTFKDPLGNLNRITYDVLGRISDAVDGLGHTTQRTYDGNDNLLTFEDARGGITQFAYDSRNRVSSKTDPLSKVEGYQYDSIGNLSRVTDRKGQVTGYGYDFLNRRVIAGFGATVGSPTSYTSTITYDWDAGDRMTEAVDSVSGAVTRVFDGLNRLTQERSPQGQIDYTFYANGLRQTMTVHGQAAVAYSYDDASRLTQIAQGSATVGFTYDSLDRRSALTLPSGIVATYTHDEADQLTGITYQKGSTTLGALTYVYDQSGRRSGAGGTLTQIDLPATIAAATYDASNRLTIWDGRSLNYDDNGALTSDGDSTPLNYVWDIRGRLSQILSGSTSIAAFQYDAFDRRTRKVINGVATNFLSDGWQVVQELSGGTPSANLLTGLNVDEIFQRTSNSGVEEFLTDALGSAVVLTDGAGVVQTVYTYEPYGKTTMTGVSTTNSYQYTGRENDEEIYYYRNRYFNTALHRFISEDPIGLAGGMNAFLYVNASPINYVDPYGLDATDWNNTSGGRSRLDGPTNGNWGGKCWSGGQYSCGKNKPGDKPPTDSGDQCYKRHDECYVRCGKDKKCIAACDGALVDELNGLSSNPRKWLSPPRPGTEKDSQRYRDWAIKYFTP